MAEPWKAPAPRSLRSVPRLGRRVRHFTLGRLLPNRRLVASGDVGRSSLMQRLRLQRLLPARLRSGSKGSDPSGAAATGDVGVRLRAGTLGRVGLLRGCVMEPWFGEVNRAAEICLTRAGYESWSHRPNQTCCGALGGSRRGDARGDSLWPTRTSRLSRVSTWSSQPPPDAALTCATTTTSVAAPFWPPTARDITEVVAVLIEAGHLPRLDGGPRDGRGSRSVPPPSCPEDHDRPADHPHRRRIHRRSRSIRTGSVVEPPASTACCGRMPPPNWDAGRQTR